jgi:hypothetical protein
VRKKMGGIVRGRMESMKMRGRMKRGMMGRGFEEEIMRLIQGLPSLNNVVGAMFENQRTNNCECLLSAQDDATPMGTEY